MNSLGQDEIWPFSTREYEARCKNDIRAFHPGLETISNLTHHYDQGWGLEGIVCFSFYYILKGIM